MVGLFNIYQYEVTAGLVFIYKCPSKPTIVFKTLNDVSPLN